MGLTLVIIGSILLALFTGFYVYYFIGLVRSHGKVEYKPELKDTLFLSLFPLTLGISICSIVLGSYDLTKQTLEISNALMIGFGSVLSIYFFISFIQSFILYYYKKNLDSKFKRILGWSYFLSLILFFVFLFWVWLEGASKYMLFPLTNGIGIDDTGFHWNTFQQSSKGFNLAFYAICILSGAVFVYFLCDHKLYKKYGEHGLLESTFFIAFPAGIIGARIWYVVGEWDKSFGPVFSTDPWKMFRMWDGGLTIMGGAFFGIVVGVLWVVLTKKKFKVLDVVDIIVPTILLAQAIGRWGNFFNHEVYGQTQLLISDVWYLPSFIKNQMATSFTNGVPGNMMYMPLFLIEGLCNIGGYFLLVYGFGEKHFITKSITFVSNKISVLARKKELTEKTKFTITNALPLGSLLGMYLIYYGAIRFVLEPLRDPNYNMGVNGQWSNTQSIVYMIIGASVVILLAIFQYVLMPKIIENRKNKPTEKDSGSLND